MKKHQQKQILDLLQTIYGAQKERLFDDCRLGAEAINGFIKSVDGENTQTSVLIEQYCRLLIKAQRGEVSEGKLRKKLIQVENCAKDELKQNKIDVVFFPYQISMFDAFESVYLAAKADPDCNVYVVPIPYYELNPDRTLGKMYYDGNKYPNDMPITDWKTYDVAERHPDVIFTHYPYDDNVSNATIHPSFYSKRLRKYCNSLVYVPYFITPNDMVGEFCGYLPGIVYAHYVIVQSEGVRQSYMKHYRKFGMEFGWNDQFGKAEKKFIALGSPKFDKMINSKCDDTLMPEQWKRLLYKSDGTKKKIILYNTHMFAWLNGGAAYFKKIRYVFDTFKNRDDVVLWWRPHPNTELNFRTKRPQMYSEYEKLVTDYKRSGWGIYDDTPDLHRALAMSDAYYGDVSSLVALYAVTGNPIMVENVNLYPENNSEYALLFNSFYDDGAHYWFAVHDFNALFKMDKQTWKAEYVGTFPFVTNAGGVTFSAVAECDGKLYFSPSGADFIGVFDFAENKFSRIAFRDFGSPHFIKFHTVHTSGKNVYFFGVSYPAIIKLDTETLQIKYISDYVETLNELKCNTDNLFFGIGYVQGNEMFLPAQSANAVVIFNMDSDTAKVVKVPSKHRGYVDMCFDGESYWLAPRYSGGTVVKWNPRSGVTELSVPDGWADGLYWNLCFANGYIWYFPIYGNTAFCVNVSNNAVEISEPFMAECNRPGTGIAKANYFAPGVVGDTIFVHTRKSNTFIEYNIKTDTKREEEIIMPPEDREKCVNDILLSHCRMEAHNAINDCVFNESTTFTLVDFLDSLMNKPKEIWNEIKEAQIEVYRRNTKCADGTAGVTIYNEIKKKNSS